MGLAINISSDNVQQHFRFEIDRWLICLSSNSIIPNVLFINPLS